MGDSFSKEMRSLIMSKIRAKDTKLELGFLKEMSSVLYRMGYRYRKHYKRLPGSPDVVFVGKKIAIFLDGDFWHGYKFGKIRNKTRKRFWSKKIGDNVKRDRRVNFLLKKMGWRVLRFWEHQIKKDPQKAIMKIEKVLKK